MFCECGSSHNNGQPFSARSPFNAPIYPIKELAQPPNKYQKQSAICNASFNTAGDKNQPGERSPGKSGLPGPEDSPQRLPGLCVGTGNQMQLSNSWQKFQQNANFSPSQCNSQGLILQQQGASVNTSLVLESQGQQHPKVKYEKPGSDVYLTIQKLISQQQPQKNYEPFYKHINQIVCRMINWELLDEKEIVMCIATLKLILSSKICNILADAKYIDWLTRVLDSQNMPLNIQLLALEVIQTVCKNISHKKIVIQRDILHTLIKIATSCLHENERDKYDKQLVIQAIQCLALLGGTYDRRAYIPGETRENEQIRKILIEGSGLLAVIIINRKCLSDEIKAETQAFLANLSIADLEYQLEIAQKLKELTADQNQPKPDLAQLAARHHAPPDAHTQDPGHTTLDGGSLNGYTIPYSQARHSSNRKNAFQSQNHSPSQSQDNSLLEGAGQPAPKTDGNEQQSSEKLEGGSKQHTATEHTAPEHTPPKQALTKAGAIQIQDQKDAGTGSKPQSFAVHRCRPQSSTARQQRAPRPAVCPSLRFFASSRLRVFASPLLPASAPRGVCICAA